MAIPSSWLRRIDSSTSIGNLSNKTILMVSSVGCGLESSIRKSNGEGSGNISVSILSLSLLEVNLRVVIGYTILISIWLGSKLLLLVNRGRGVLGGGNSQEGTGSNELKQHNIITCFQK